MSKRTGNHRLASNPVSTRRQTNVRGVRTRGRPPMSAGPRPIRKGTGAGMKF